jgi:hypothetical protein
VPTLRPGLTQEVYVIDHSLSTAPLGRESLLALRHLRKEALEARIEVFEDARDEIGLGEP